MTMLNLQMDCSKFYLQTVFWQTRARIEKCQAIGRPYTHPPGKVAQDFPK